MALVLSLPTWAGSGTRESPFILRMPQTCYTCFLINDTRAKPCTDATPSSMIGGNSHVTTTPTHSTSTTRGSAVSSSVPESSTGMTHSTNNVSQEHTGRTRSTMQTSRRMTRSHTSTKPGLRTTVHTSYDHALAKDWEKSHPKRK